MTMLTACEAQGDSCLSAQLYVSGELLGGRNVLYLLLAIYTQLAAPLFGQPIFNPHMV